MSAENLLYQARQNLNKDEEARRRKLEVDGIYAKLRRNWEQILTDYGQVQRSIFGRLEIGFFASSVIGLPFIVLSELWSRRSAQHIWESQDTVRWEGKLNTGVPEVPVQIIARDGISPAKVATIDVKVQGLDKFLRLHKDFGEIVKPTNNMERYKNSLSWRSSDFGEAQQWQELVREVQQYLQN